MNHTSAAQFTFLSLLLVLLTAAAALTQETEEDKRWQLPEIHGFISQGFMYSSHNNFLTLDSSKGSLDWHEIGLNTSFQITSYLRAGLQVFARDLGELGNDEIQLDWAYLDLHISDLFGLRAGKIKTPFGLYNDEQDLAFLHTWVLFPQGMYPSGQRSQNLAHTGLDIYGFTGLRSLGTLQYQLFGGTREIDSSDGYFKRFRDSGNPITSFDAKWLAGFTSTWQLPGDELAFTFSALADKYEIIGNNTSNGNGFRRETDGARQTYRLGIEYETERFLLAFEIQETRQDLIDENLEDPLFGTGGKGHGTGKGQGSGTAGGQGQGDGTRGGSGGGPGHGSGGGTGSGNGNSQGNNSGHGDSSGRRQLLDSDQRAWYLSAVFRFSGRWEAGAYYSDFLSNTNLPDDDPENYLRDLALSLRYQFNDGVSAKIELHKIEGLALGLLDSSNPGGYETDWLFIAANISFNF